MENALNGPCNEHLLLVTKGGKVFERFLRRFGFQRVQAVPLKLEV
jgi:hypothetical protein